MAAAASGGSVISYEGHDLADDAHAMRLVLAALQGDSTAYAIALSDVPTDQPSMRRLVDALANFAAHAMLQPAQAIGLTVYGLRRDLTAVFDSIAAERVAR